MKKTEQFAAQRRPLVHLDRETDANIAKTLHHLRISCYVVDLDAFFASHKQPAFVHQSQMARNIRLRSTQLRYDLRHGLFLFARGMHDLQARRFGKHAEIRCYDIKGMLKCFHFASACSCSCLADHAYWSGEEETQTEVAFHQQHVIAETGLHVLATHLTINDSSHACRRDAPHAPHGIRSAPASMFR